MSVLAMTMAVLQTAGEVQPMVHPPIILRPGPPVPPVPPGAHPYPIIAPPSPPPGYRPAPARRVAVPPQRARANLQSYFSEDDYPASALRARVEGVTLVRLVVGPTGRVQDCSVIASSGNIALDQATCRILRSRARYRPAFDSAGAPVVGADRGRIVWRLPAR